MTQMSFLQGLALGLIGLACASHPTTTFADSLGAVLGNSKPSLALRIRHETSDQDNGLRRADANVLRHRLGLTTDRWRGMALSLETEGTVALGDEHYNSGPGGNGNSEFSVIADPTGNEVNQAFVDFAPTGTHALRVGRQRIIFDNARFIGNVGWRQNEQTFDAVSLQAKLAPMTLQYAFLGNVNRIFFDNVDLEAHLLNVQARLGSALSGTIYGYLLDYKEGEDTQTLGLRLNGERELSALKLSYAVEFARQSDFADSDLVDADYLSLEAGVAKAGLSIGVGREVLGGDGNRSFSTPLATLHKFNGFADIFLTTPPNGLVDHYLKMAYARGQWKWLAKYHLFDAETGGAEYGTEVDAVMVYQHTKTQSVVLKYANYSATDFAVDTQKFTLDLNFRF